MSRKYIYTDKHHSYTGIMATVLGLIDLVSLFVVVRKTYLLGGEAPARYGATVSLIFIFALAGLILGLIGKSDEDSFSAFAYIGIGLNIAAILGVSGLLYAGAYGL